MQVDEPAAGVFVQVVAAVHVAVFAHGAGAGVVDPHSGHCMTGRDVLGVVEVDGVAADVTVQVAFLAFEVRAAVVGREVVGLAADRERVVHAGRAGLDVEVGDVAVVSAVALLVLVEQVDVVASGALVQVVVVERPPL